MARFRETQPAHPPAEPTDDKTWRDFLDPEEMPPPYHACWQFPAQSVEFKENVAMYRISKARQRRREHLRRLRGER